MKKTLIAVFAMAACCFAANPYTGLMKNLNIATFGIEDYSKVNGNHEDDLTDNVNFATGFRNSLQNHVSKKYPTTTFGGSYSNKYSSDVTVSKFKNEIKNDHNIVMFSGHGVSTYSSEHDVSRHNELLMYDGYLQVEKMTFSKQTYFAFFDACNFLSFYTDDYGRDKYGYYYKYRDKRGLVTDPITNYSADDADGWEDSQEAKPQNIAFSRFKDAFAKGLHGMFGYSSLTISMTKTVGGKEKADTDLYETFAKKWVDDGLRIWQAYKYAVWKHVYKGYSQGVEPAVIFKSGTAIGNDGKNHSFKGYCEFYKTIYQYPMEKGSLGRKKAVYGKPEY